MDINDKPAVWRVYHKELVELTSIVLYISEFAQCVHQRIRDAGPLLLFLHKALLLQIGIGVGDGADIIHFYYKDTTVAGDGLGDGFAYQGFVEGGANDLGFHTGVGYHW